MSCLVCGFLSSTRPPFSRSYTSTKNLILHRSSQRTIKTAQPTASSSADCDIHGNSQFFLYLTCVLCSRFPTTYHNAPSDVSDTTNGSLSNNTVNGSQCRSSYLLKPQQPLNLDSFNVCTLTQASHQGAPGTNNGRRGY